MNQTKKHVGNQIFGKIKLKFWFDENLIELDS